MSDLKTEVTRKQSMPNFPKKEHSLHPDTHMYVVCVSGGKECSFFGKFGVLLFLVSFFFYGRISFCILGNIETLPQYIRINQGGLRSVRTITTEHPTAQYHPESHVRLKPSVDIGTR